MDSFAPAMYSPTNTMIRPRWIVMKPLGFGVTSFVKSVEKKEPRQFTGQTTVSIKIHCLLLQRFVEINIDVIALTINACGHQKTHHIFWKHFQTRQVVGNVFFP